MLQKQNCLDTFYNGLNINPKTKLIALVVIFFIFSVHATPVKFYSINAKFGISMRDANSICKDDYGFIWASSKAGILRLTEDDCHIYNLPYENAAIITVKLVYKDLKLIAYTNDGQIFLYNPVYDRFDLLLSLSKVLDNKQSEVSSLLIDDSGNFWISSSAGLYQYQSGRLSLMFELPMESYLMTWFDKQTLIIAGRDGIYLYDTRSLKRKCIYENNSLNQLFISSLFFDKIQNRLWIGTLSHGLFRYDFNLQTFSGILQSYFPKQPILAIEEFTESSILIGVDGQGIWELNKGGDLVLNIYKENVDDPYSLHGNGVYDIFCDSGKRVWICTISGGVSFIDQATPLVNHIVHHTNNANSLENNEINSIIEDHSGKIWFATNNGISCWDVSTNRWENFYCDKLKQTQVFLALCEDDQGRIWAGSYSSGVYVLDQNTGRELAHYSQDEEESQLKCNFIFCIFKDSHGDIWIGGVNGEFACYYSNEDKFRIFSTMSIGEFAELSDNQFLIAGGNGLSLLNKHTGDIQTLLMGFLVHDILIMGENVWICTGGDGLLRYHISSGATEKFTVESGLPSNFINSIIYANDYLWIGTERGLCRLNPEDKTVLTFSSMFSLSGLSYNRNAHCKLKNGQVAWGTNNGAVLFRPESIREGSSNGRIFYQNLTVSGRSIREIPTFKLNTPIDSLQAINLKHSQNNVSLELLPIGTQPGSKFSWKMEGFDHDWTPPTYNRIITYTNIPSGKFVLKIRLYESSLFQIIAERSLTIGLIPPFWRRGWFYMLLCIVISGILFLLLLYYINRLKRKHTEEKMRFFTNTAHDIRNSLTLIKAPVEELDRETKLSEPGRQYLQIAIEQVRRLSSVVTQLLDFQKVDIGKQQISFSAVNIFKLISSRILMFESFAKSRNIELVFTSDRQHYVTAVDESKIEKVVDNLISNAVKYSHTDTQVWINLHCDDSKWILQVKDRGIGISRKAQRKLFKEFYRAENAINSKVVGSGIGLLLVKNYVTMHGGIISFESEVNVGSTFQVVIPYKKMPVSEFHPASDLSKDQTQHTLIGNRIYPSKELKLLIVDDNEDLLNFMCDILNRDFEVTTAEDGVEAWKFISKKMPDLIVSDVMMPGMDGFKLCQLLKSTFATSHIPIILLTALSEKAEQLHGLGLGADDYLTKPFDINILVQRIKTIICNREVVRKKALQLIRGSSAEPILANELNDKFVRKMLDVVWANISNFDFNKEDFASAMNVSPSLLYKKCKSLTDQSPTDFIKTIRLDYAFELLMTHKHTVAEVSAICGFASPGYFSTVFRKFFGKSPTMIPGEKEIHIPC
jgi:signal transduction histidine kinase/CheY-like chemotaxis protein/ligand-binding sensor domain-containing protein